MTGRVFGRWRCRLAGVCLAVVLSGVAPWAAAATLTDLYAVDLVANNESAEARNLALRQALFAVLDRIIVSKDIAQIGLVQQMLQNAPQYVKQSQFSALAADGFAPSAARKFSVEFDEDQLLSELSKSSLRFWGEVRPETLLWLAVDEDDGSGWRFFNADDMPDIDAALSLARKVKGMPLIYPLLDLEERQKVAVNDLFSNDSGNIKTASARYETPAVLVGRLVKKGGCWEGGWVVYFNGEATQTGHACQTLNLAVQAGVRDLYDVLSAYYAIKSP